MATVTSDDQVAYDDYIDQQIVRTSFHVKTVELVLGLIVLSLVVLGTSLLLVLVDHWVVGLSVTARITSLLLILGSAGGVLATRVARPLFRSVNPEYSALAVERSFPKLTNALSSFLFFRDRREMVRDSIYVGLRHQVATELTEVPIDSAVDRGSIVRWGYALVAITAIWCLYILVSPKSPFQTLQRIIMPWHDIARPSEVDILSVSPGSTEVFRGQSLEIQTQVQGLEPSLHPWIEYSTLDGQAVAQRSPMVASSRNGHFSGALATGENGIYQDVEYRVVAGDAVSATYLVRTKIAPHIVVERIDYEFPSYTGLAPETMTGVGDIRAMEGTRVRITGRANQDIQSGHIQLLPSAEADSSKLARQAPLVVDGQKSDVRFTLRMDAQRTESIYRAYRLRFRNADGQSNTDPVEHSIQVTPDLSPIVEIVEPVERTVEVPENGWRRIEVRAVDPDFELTRVVLVGRTRNRALFRKLLLDRGHAGQFTASFNFVPSEFGLQDGDVVTYEAAAEDNRHSPLQGKLEPNRAVSWKYVFRIVADDPLADPAPEQDSATSPSEADQDPPSEQPHQQDKQSSNEADGDGQKSQPNQQPQDREPKDSQQTSSEEEEPTESGQQGESGLQQSGGGQGEAQREELDSGQSGETSDQQQSSRDGGGNQETDPSGGTGDSEPTPDGNSNPDSSRNSENPGETGQPDASEEPLPSTGERDAEVIDRIRRHMEDQGELDSLPEANPSDDSASDDSSSDSTSSKDSAADRGSEPNPRDAARERQDSQGADPSSEKDSGDATGAEQESPAQESGGQDGANDSPRDSTSQDVGQEGSDAKPREDGQPGDQQGATGDQQNRHSDAASRADDSEPSPPDSATSSDNPSAPEGADSGDSPAADQNSEQTESSTTESSKSPDGPGEDATNPETANSDPSSQSGDDQAPNGQPQSGGDQPQAGQGKQGDSGDDSKATGEPNTNGTKESTSQSRDQAGKKSGTEGASAPGSESSSADAQGGGADVAQGDATGDAANLEYSKKVTDLVLDYLKDQKRNPDPELLEKLGWKQDDVDAFLRRWDEMKRNAGREGAEGTKAKQQLDDVLRSLQLDPRRRGPRRANSVNEQRRTNRNSGRRIKVPDELLDPFRAFQRSLRRGG